MFPRIKPAHRLALAPIARAFVSLAIRPGGDVPGKDPLTVAAQVRLTFLQQFRKGFARQRLVAALAEIAILLSGKLELISPVPSAIVQSGKRRYIKPAGVLKGLVHGLHRLIEYITPVARCTGP